METHSEQLLIIKSHLLTGYRRICMNAEVESVARLQPLCGSPGTSVLPAYVLRSLPSWKLFLLCHLLLFAFFVTPVCTEHWVDTVGALCPILCCFISQTQGCLTAACFLLEKERVNVSYWVSLVQSPVCPTS